jgi:hypothetical protein
MTDKRQIKLCWALVTNQGNVLPVGTTLEVEESSDPVRITLNNAHQFTVSQTAYLAAIAPSPDAVSEMFP